MAFKNGINNLLQKIGYRIINVKDNNQTLSGHIRNLFTSYKINTVIDVGAHQGRYGLFLRNIGYDGIIHSFEPVTESFNKLRETTSRDKKWHIHKYALGEDSVKRNINVYNFDTFSSFHNKSNYSKHRWPLLEIKKTESVQVKRLDEVFDEFGIINSESLFFLKMDTQGYDLSVFRGAEKVLEHINIIQSEVSMIPIYDGMPVFEDCLSVFRQKGYKISGMFPVSRENNSLAVIEYDCVMVR